METEDNRYVKQTPYAPAKPRRPGDIDRPVTPGCPPSPDKGTQEKVEKVIEDSSGLP